MRLRLPLVTGPWTWGMSREALTGAAARLLVLIVIISAPITGAVRENPARDYLRAFLDFPQIMSTFSAPLRLEVGHS